MVNAFVHVHGTLQAANARLARRGARTMAITPRHYLDFINQYVKLHAEKRAELEEDQRHLNVGLNKIRETEVQVKELQKSLSAKSAELEAKNAAANAKLKQMLEDQAKAEREKTLSEELGVELKVEAEQIAAKKAEVQVDLAKVEPAVIEAQAAVKNINRANLVEMRSLASPPAAIKTALEAACILLDEDFSDWKSIRNIVMKENFLNRVLQYNTEQITPAIKNRILKDYMTNPDWEVEKAFKASRACGPLVQWARAQIAYADMLHRVSMFYWTVARVAVL